MESMRNFKNGVLAVVVFLFLAGTAPADTITVGPGGPGGGYDYATIQEGINAAISGASEEETQGSKLEFRILPDSVLSSRAPSPLRLENEMEYRKDILENGPDDGRRRGDEYIWLEVEKYEPAKFPLLVIETIGEKSYVLAANLKNKMMLADGTWGLQKVYPKQDQMGRPGIGFEFDEKSDYLFYQFTSSNINTRLAIIIDGKIYSAPQINSAIRGKGIITGDFTEAEVAKVIGALEKGMPVVTPKPRGQQPGFDPVIEITINDNVAVGKNSNIDFDTGRLFPRPENWQQLSDDDWQRWIEKTGVDASGATRATVKGLMCDGMIFSPSNSSWWEETPAHALATMDLWGKGKPGRPAYMTAQGQLPATYIFKTREEGIGILQITGFSESPKGVNIHYKMLQDTGVQIGEVESKKEKLQTAIADGDIDEVKKLIEEGADINAKDEIGRAPLHFVKNKAVAELLIAKGADVNARTKDGSTLLHTMAWNGNKEIVGLLLENGADVNAKHNKGHTPLHFAVRTGKKEVVELLLTNGALVNANDEWGYTPLHWANKKDYRDIAELLLINGENKNLLYQKQDSIANLHMADAIMKGDLGRVKNFIEEGANVNAQTIIGEPPLSLAAKRGHEDIVQFLIAKGADINAIGKDGQTALHEAKNRNVAELLIANGANVNAKISEDARRLKGWTPLHTAVLLTRRMEVAQLLIAKGADINAMNADGETPLDVAKWSEKDMAKLLIANGATISNLHTAVYIGDFAKVKSLIAKDADITAKDKRGRTALFYVDDKQIAEFLIAKGLDVNTKAEDGSTALHDATGHGYKDIVEILIAQGADVNAADKNGRTPLYIAVSKDHIDIVRQLIANGANLNIKDKEGRTLLHSVRSKELAEWLISKGADMNAKENVYGGTPLILANKDVAEVLIANGADVNARGEKNWTALHFAAWRGNIDLAELLISKGADIKAQGRDGIQPLHMTASIQIQEALKQQKVAELLIAKGADINVVSKAAGTPLHMCATYGHEKLALFFIDNGANVNAKNKDGSTPLHSLGMGNAKKIAELLIAKGADINACDNKNRTPLHIAAERGLTGLAELFLAKGLDVNAKDKSDNTPLYEAIGSERKDVVKFLIAKGADVNWQNKIGQTPLHYAVRNKPSNLLKLLIESGGNVNTRDRNGRTPLHLAVNVGNGEKVKLLTDKGADVNAKDTRGSTPLDYAARKKNQKVVEFLIKNGAHSGSEPVSNGVEELLDEKLYQKQDSIKNALEFIGTPEDRMNSNTIKHSGQLASPEQLVLVNKLIKANFDKDVNMLLSILSDGTKKEV